MRRKSASMPWVTRSTLPRRKPNSHLRKCGKRRRTAWRRGKPVSKSFLTRIRSFLYIIKSDVKLRWIYILSYVRRFVVLHVYEQSTSGNGIGVFKGDCGRCPRCFMDAVEYVYVFHANLCCYVYVFCYISSSS